ncbi:MAG: D-alanine--D-alanine ligase [Spirochaetes bacterium]|jgi:D-alanine-D-alanine ligase|nr:D-alanine--D-alanine ligase [Spirochaetota bacterium]
MTRVGILYGGRSGEHEVSLHSAASVVHRLDVDRFQAVPIGITREGEWFSQDHARVGREAATDGVLTITADEANRVSVVPARGIAVAGEYLEVDVVFPVLHGSFGEDGTVQGMLEMTGIPYVGAAVLGSALGMDKELAKQLWQQAGLPAVPFQTLRREHVVDEAGSIDRHRIEKAAGRIARILELPWFVKPARAGSSVGVTRIRSLDDFPDAARAALAFDTKLLVEPQIAGREIECSVIGAEEIRTFPPGEIKPRGGFYSYQAKYVDPEGAALFVPAEIDERTASDIRSVAAAAYRAVDCEGFARIDFFLEGDSGKFYLNEINTIPGFTNISMFPKLCEAGGLPYKDLLTELISLALRRHGLRSALSYQWS